LASVPHERRTAPEFQKAVGRMAHLCAARRRWLHRLGQWPETPHLFPTETTLDDLPEMVAGTEAGWTQYLDGLADADLAREIEWQLADGRRFRWNVEGILTQTFGHAWYHRGQVAQLVAGLGGRAVDTDYILWCKPTQIEPEKR
ncbi:MAG TPA: DinB family protein, partial [Gemmataceae bacterium]|nr:DinB family protein [Gemmataceae bacterium]